MHFGLGPDLHHEAADAPLAQSAALPFRQRGLRLFTQCGSDSGHSGPGYPLKIFLLHLCWSFEPHSFIFFSP